MKRSPDDIYDELLVLRAQSGEREALAALFERWEPKMRRFIIRLTDDATRADVMQETWLAMAHGLHRLQDPAMFRFWIYRIAGRKCADAVRERRHDRTRRRHTVDDDAAAGESASGSASAAFDQQNKKSVVELDEDVKRLRHALDQLAPDDRAMLHLRYVEDMTVPMIAIILDCPDGTIKSRLHTLRSELKSIMEMETTPIERSVSDERPV